MLRALDQLDHMTLRFCCDNHCSTIPVALSPGGTEFNFLLTFGYTGIWELLLTAASTAMKLQNLKGLD